MKKNDKFKKKLQADIALIEARLIRFRIQGMGFTAGAKDRHEEHVEQFEQKIDSINERLSNFEKTDKHLWGYLRGSIEKSFHKLQAALDNATQKFKAQPGVSGPHGGDDGPFPYGEGLSSRGFANPKKQENKFEKQPKVTLISGKE
jgi:hypothetical protein